MPNELKKKIDTTIAGLAEELEAHASASETRAREAERKLKTVEKRLARDTERPRKQIDQLRNERRDLKGERNRLSRERDRLADKVASLEAANREMERRLDALTHHVTRLDDERTVSTELFEHAQKELHRRRRVANHLKSEAAAQAESHAQTRESLEAERDAARAERDNHRARRADALRRLRGLHRRMRRLTATGEERRRKLDAVQRKHQTMSKDNAAARATLAERTKERDALHQQLDATRQSSAQLESQHAASTEMIRGLRRELTEVRRHLTDTETRLRRAEQEKKTSGIPFWRRPERLAPKTAADTENASDAADSGPLRSDDTDKPDGLFLRVDGGAVYGPAPLKTLKAWAADARIGPNHEVSTDQREWHPAHRWTELEMDRTVTLADGTRFGPIHRDAVHHITQWTDVAAGEAG